MRLTLTLASLIILTAASAAHANSSCGPLTTKDNAKIERVIGICRQESQAQGRKYLDSWIAEKSRNCIGMSPYEKNPSESLIKCQTDIVASAREILLCADSAERQQQAIDFDVEQTITRFKGFPSAQPPADIQKIFAQLTALADRSFRYRFQRPKWSLTGFEHEVPNATAAAGGAILASSALWSGPNVFTRNEIAAILGHEIGHVLKEHSLKLGCLAVEWIGAEHTIKSATADFREDMSNGFPRKDAWSRMSQDFEYEADQMSIEILKRAGYDPRSMAQALERLKPKGPGGFSSGSHPEMDDRIKKALDNLEAGGI